MQTLPVTIESMVHELFLNRKFIVNSMYYDATCTNEHSVNGTRVIPQQLVHGEYHVQCVAGCAGDDGVNGTRVIPQ